MSEKAIVVVERPKRAEVVAAGPIIPVGDGSGVTWAEVSDKPATFPPAAHTHDYLTQAEGDALYQPIGGGGGAPLVLDWTHSVDVTGVDVAVTSGLYQVSGIVATSAAPVLALQLSANGGTSVVTDVEGLHTNFIGYQAPSSGSITGGNYAYLAPNAGGSAGTLMNFEATIDVRSAGTFVRATSYEVGQATKRGGVTTYFTPSAINFLRFWPVGWVFKPGSNIKMWKLG